MSMETDIAVSVIKLAIEGVTYSVRIAGKAVSGTAKILTKFVNANKYDTPGKKSLKDLLKSGKSLEVFAIKDKYLKKFTQEAKKYGVQYHVIKDNNNTDHFVDILVDVDNAKMCNRIIERYSLQIDDRSIVKGEESAKETKENQETKNVEENANEKDVENKESEIGVSKPFLESENPYKDLLKNNEDFEVEEKMSVKEVLTRLKELFDKTRKRIMEEKSIRKERKEQEIERL